MSTSLENLLNISIRKSSAFNLFHEAAILKETKGPEAPRAKTGDRILSVGENVVLELKHLKDLPALSYKWTWGETLSEEEVLKLNQSGLCLGRGKHSGYGISLLDGKPAGEYSDYLAPSSQSSNVQYEDLLAETSLVPPPTDLCFPTYFSNPVHQRLYNPYKIYKVSEKAPSQASTAPLGN